MSMVGRVNGTRNANAAGKKSGQVSNWNLPNFLTALRIIFIPFFAWLVLRGDDTHIGWMWGGFITFALMMLTDKLDGDIARARGLETDFGRIADPIADKALMITALVCLNIVGALPWWVSAIIIVRELGITVWRMVQLRRGKVLPAGRGGKLKTALQTLAIGLYLLPLPGWLDIPVAVIMAVTVVLTVATGIQYLWEFYGPKKNPAKDPAKKRVQ